MTTLGTHLGTSLHPSYYMQLSTVARRCLPQSHYLCLQYHLFFSSSFSALSLRFASTIFLPKTMAYHDISPENINSVTEKPGDLFDAPPRSALIRS